MDAADVSPYASEDDAVEHEPELHDANTQGTRTVCCLLPT